MSWDIIVALAASALSGTGIGGGGLLVIYLTLVKNVGQLCAQGINLAFFLSGASSALPVHFHRRKMDMRAVVLIGLTGAVFAYLGLMLARMIDGRWLRVIFGAMLALCGLKVIKK